MYTYLQKKASDDESVVTTLPDGTVLTLEGDVNLGARNPYDKFRDLKLKRQRPGEAELVTDGALAYWSASDENGRPLFNETYEDPFYAQSIATDYNDVRDTAGYKLGANIRKTLTESSDKGSLGYKISNWTRKHVPRSVLAGAVMGGGTALAAFLANKLGGYDFSTGSAALLGGALGIGGQMYLDHYAKRLLLMNRAQQAMQQAYSQLNKSGSIEKRAMLYHDPRNFILEKLLRDTSLSMSDKAMIAGKIRNMSMPEASNVEKMVRSAVGVGVGAMLAKYFGVGGGGAILGGILGGLAFNQMGFGGNLLQNTRKPSMYDAFHHGGTGFKTYNEFFRSVNTI